MSTKGSGITSDELLEEAIPLIAQARTGLGITSARAAERAGTSSSRYRDLEAGRVPRNKQSVHQMVEVAKSLGLKSVRACYADAIDQYLRVGVARDEPLTVFFDALDSPVANLISLWHYTDSAQADKRAGNRRFRHRRLSRQGATGGTRRVHH